MLDRFWENTVKMLFIKSAMDAVAAYRPLNKTPAQVQAMLDEREVARAAHVAADSGLEMGQSGVRSALVEARREALRAYALMKSIYADDGDHLAVIVRIPKKNWSAKHLLLRMEKTVAAWEELPNPPGSVTPFQSNDVSLDDFKDLREALLTKFTACVGCQRDFDKAKAASGRVDKAQRRFIARALAIGRAQFLPGTDERGIIDGIPTEPSAQPPGEVNFQTAESHAPGEVTLQFEADHATAFRVEHAGPGDAAFTTVATVPGPDNQGSYAATGLPAGLHQYRVHGANSRGEGPGSPVQSIEVAAEAAA